MVLKILITAAVLVASTVSHAADTCSNLPNYVDLQKALKEVRETANGGLNLDMWATLVDRSGVVCAVAFTGAQYDTQWLGSRVISAQKANTANAFSLVGLALSTANLYSAVQPGGSLFGLQESNPVDTQVAYAGDSSKFGTSSDPMKGKRIGGVNVFGGGLALYNAKGEIVGGVGVSGDTSCADHNIAWKLRNKLSLDYVPGGVSSTKNDQIIFDIKNGKSAGGFGHPECGKGVATFLKDLPPSRKVK